MGTAISVCFGGGPICAAPACDVTVALGCSLSISGIAILVCGVTAMPGYAASPMGAPCALSSICLFANAAVIIGETPPVGSVITLAPLPPSVALGDPWHLN
jgi:hypothetical protein